MSEARDPAIDALIAAARADFAESLASKAADLETMVARGAWQDARRAAHKLSGSAGVYGFAALGAIMAALDELLAQADGAPDESMRRRIQEKLVEGVAEVERASREVP